MNSNVKIYPNAIIRGKDNVSFGDNIIIDDFVFIYAKKEIILGNFVHLAIYSSITGGEKVTIGDFTAISQGARLLTATDDFKDWGFGNSTVPEEYRNVKRSPINIGKFCIVGANSVVLPGVSIGEGCTIGACSVVTRNLDPWGVYIGNKRIADRQKLKVLSTYNKFINETSWNE